MMSFIAAGQSLLLSIYAIILSRVAQLQSAGLFGHSFNSGGGGQAFKLIGVATARHTSGHSARDVCRCMKQNAKAIAARIAILLTLSEKAEQPDQQRLYDCT
jgi:hypothetical protein